MVANGKMQYLFFSLFFPVKHFLALQERCCRAAHKELHMYKQTSDKQLQKSGEKCWGLKYCWEAERGDGGSDPQQIIPLPDDGLSFSTDATQTRVFAASVVLQSRFSWGQRWSLLPVMVKALPWKKGPRPRRGGDVAQRLDGERHNQIYWSFENTPPLTLFCTISTCSL